MPTDLKNDKYVALFSQLERLWHLDDGTSCYFGLNLSTSLANCSFGNQGADAALLPNFRLWRKNVLGVVFAAQTLPAPITVPLRYPLNVENPANHGLVLDRIDNEIAARDVDWTWNYEVATAPKDVTIDDEAKRPLRGLCGDWSARPYPLAEWMQLRMIFTVDKAVLDTVPDGTNMAAVPVFDDIQPTVAGPDFAGLLWQFTDRATPAADVQFIAFVNPSLKSDPLAIGDSFIDLSSYWIKKKNDWRASRVTDQLAGRIAAAMDPAQRLIDAMRASLQNAVESNLQLQEKRDAVLAALRDTAGLGLFPKPDGFPAIRLSDPALAIPYEAGMTLAAWQTILQKAIPEARTLRVLQPVFKEKDFVSVEDLIEELQQLQRLLADGTVLKRVVETQIQEAKVGVAVDELSSDTIRGRLLAGHLGCFWKDVTGKILEPAIESAFVEYCTKRFSAGGDVKGQIRYPKTTYVMSNTFKSLLENRMGELEKELEDPTTPQVSETQTAHPITIQVDVASRRDDAAEDQSDFQRSLAGVGLLMRQKDQEWRCLNVAEAVFSGQEVKPRTEREVLFSPTTVPLQLSARDGVPQVFLTYDAKPLAARILLEGTLGSPGPSSMPSTISIDPVFGYGATDHERWKNVPALRFGKDYEVAGYVIGQSGALPKALADPSHAAKLITAGTITVPADSIHSVEYRRRTGIGPLRVEGIGKELDNTEHLPSNVYPLAKDLGLIGDKGRGVTTGAAFLLLQETNQELRVSVRKPSTDLQVWDRWQERTIFDREIVWKEHRRRVLANAKLSPGGPRFDETLDEPAITNELIVRLTRKDIENQVPIERSFQYATQAGPFESRAQTASIELNIKPSTDPPGITEGGEIKIPEGSVWSLQLMSSVPDAQLTAKFEPAIIERWKQTSAIEKIANNWLFNGAELLIEVATQEKPTAAEVWDALQPVAVGSQVAVRLASNAWNFRYMKQFELGRQLWRWDGRPVKRFPSNASLNSPHEDILLWEAQTMGERPNSDQFLARGSIGLNASQLSKGQTAAAEIYRDNFERDSRAHYLRYRLRLRSRYEGLYNNLQPVDSLEPPGHDSSTRPRTFWKRVLLKARPNRIPQRPLVKLVVPLTESGTENASPPLLVVLREEWFSQAGLAERFTARIEKTDADSQFPDMWQIGPDPILTGKAYGSVTSDLKVSCKGPFGFTFDTDSSNSLFSSTGFLIEFPATEADPKPWWYLAKLSFRRELTKDLCSAPEDFPLDSEWTNPEWVQSTGDFLALGKGWRLEKSGARLRILDGDGKGAKRPVIADPEANFEYWVVLTRRIQDAFGRADQESGIGVYVLDNNFEFAPQGGVLLQNWKIRARILEVQLVEPAAQDSAPSLLALIPNPDPSANPDIGAAKDLKYRGHRVGPPMDLDLEIVRS
jgi:hypothetical protein